MTHDEKVQLTRSILADLLTIDGGRIFVSIRKLGDAHSGVTILIDGKEPCGRHRELIMLWAQEHGGQLVGHG